MSILIANAHVWQRFIYFIIFCSTCYLLAILLSDIRDKNEQSLKISGAESG